MMNSNAVHSCTSRKKCLKEINIPPSPRYPWGRTSQFNNPVTVNTEKRIQDMMLTNQSFTALLFAIRTPPQHSILYVSLNLGPQLEPWNNDKIKT